MPRHHGAVPDATNSKAWILILSLGVSLFVMESAKDDILTAMDVVIWTQDGSLIRNRKTIYFSFDRFLKEIVHGNRCFICGANPELVPFNDEHVLPDWILRRYGLHNRVIILPNYTRFRYGQFKIPCCESCNSMLGEKVERSMQEMFDRGYKALAEHVVSDGPYKLFCWMCLIFLKTHLKDVGLAMHQDKRNGLEKIGELHSWSELHHIHCMSRSFYTNCNIREEAIGSLLIFPPKIYLIGNRLIIATYRLHILCFCESEKLPLSQYWTNGLERTRVRSVRRSVSNP